MDAGPRTLRAAVDLPPVPHSAAAARRVVAEVLEAWAAEVFCDDALLLVSELVSNVVRHVTGRRPLRVEMALSSPPRRSSGLRVAVVDASAAPLVLRARGPDGGHGLALVDALADRWGSEEHGDGKRVWFELERRHADRGRP
jgi:anti-sigma regulatory factor (Ser/Thr protein kinase)